MNLMNDGNTVRRLHLPRGRIALGLDCETCFEIGPVARFLYRRHDT